MSDDLEVCVSAFFLDLVPTFPNLGHSMSFMEDAGNDENSVTTTGGVSMSSVIFRLRKVGENSFTVLNRTKNFEVKASVFVFKGVSIDD